jgi:UDP-N-acetylglucosamine 1-carboxyvinyltransferase
MEEGCIIIQGGKKLKGEIQLQGAKNSVLPILSASLLVTKGESVIHNCPEISDLYMACRVLTSLCCKCRLSGNTVTVTGNDVNTQCKIPKNLMQKFRASMTFLGAMLGRYGQCEFSCPGGCDLGPRPIDFHLAAFKKMGAQIEEIDGTYYCKAENGLKGAEITLTFPSVGATENIIIAAVLAKGATVIRNAAREPEIVDLADFLIACGAKIRGAGGSTVVIEGVKELHGVDHTIIPDRIVAVTYMAAAAVTGGELNIIGARYRDMETVAALFELMGCKIYDYSDNMYITAPERLTGAGLIKTMTYPGFPTDAQAVTMAALTVAKGVSVFEENIFDNRYAHAAELRRMGANIITAGKTAVVEGVKSLYGAEVFSPDLRGGAALIVAALAAKGTTVIRNIHFVNRGYDSIETKLRSIGAEIVGA